MSDETQEPQEPAGDPDVEWIPVARWPSGSVALRADIRAVTEVLDLMDGSADDSACSVFTDFLRTVLLERRRELAVMILAEHEIAIPEPGSVPTPQERMSAQLSAAKEAVSKRRADIAPDQQPFTDRYGPGRPGLREMQAPPHPGAGLPGAGLPGLHSKLPRMPDMRPPGDQ